MAQLDQRSMFEWLQCAGGFFASITNRSYPLPDNSLDELRI
jgi:hypothetical protein